MVCAETPMRGDASIKCTRAGVAPRPAPAKKDEAHHCDAERVVILAAEQDRAELRRVVGAEQPPEGRALATFLLSAAFRSLPCVSVATGAARASPSGEYPGHAG